MYINYKLGLKRGLSLEEINLLQLIHQHKVDNSIEVLKLVPREVYKELNKRKLLHFIKPKNKRQEPIDTVRLSKKGSNLLRDLQIYKAVEEDFLLYDYLLKVFKVLDKDVEPKNKVVKLIAFFRLESGLTHREIYDLVKKFVMDEENMKYTHRMSYMIFKGENVFQKPTLEQSRLYSYYLKIKEEDDKI